MVEANQSSTYICIEPDDIFFQYLEDNIKRIKNVYKSVVVHSVKLLVGKNITNVTLDGIGGTKHAVIDSELGRDSGYLQLASIKYILI
jgi:hypothetical protein